MHPELEKILNDVINGIPDAYQNFKKRRFELKGGCSEREFVIFLSQQNALTICEPEALIDLGYLIAEYPWIIKNPQNLQTLLSANAITFNFQNLFLRLKNAAATNVGAQGAILQILAAENAVGTFNEFNIYINTEIPFIMPLHNDAQHLHRPEQAKFVHYNEAIILFSELTDEQDRTRAFEELIISANLGLALANNECGQHYENGDDDIEANWPLAVDHYKRADQQFHSRGSFNLGWMFEYGRGIPKNTKEAIACYQRSAIAGHAEAQYRLADKYENGINVQTNMEQALIWLTSALNQNYSDALFHRGWLSEIGKGMPKDLAQAAKYYLIAAEQNDFQDEAKGALRFLIENAAFKADEIIMTNIAKLLAVTENGKTHNNETAQKIKMADWLVVIEQNIDAIAKYTKIIQHHPNCPEAYLARAKAYIKINRKDAAQKDTIAAKRINANKIPKKKNFPLLTVDLKIENEKTEEAPQKLLLLIQDLLVIDPKSKVNDCIILQLKPTNEIADCLVKKIKNGHTQLSFSIRDKVKLEEIVLVTAQNLLSKFYQAVKIQNNTIEIIVSSYGHTLINKTLEKDLQNILDHVKEALPEYIIYTTVNNIKKNIHAKLNMIEKLEIELRSTIKRANSALKEIISNDFLTKNHGTLEETKSAHKKVFVNIYKMQQFITNAETALSSSTCVELKKIILDLFLLSDEQFLVESPPSVKRIENIFNSLTTLNNFNYKKNIRLLTQSMKNFKASLAKEKNLNTHTTLTSEPPDDQINSSSEDADSTEMPYEELMKKNPSPDNGEMHSDNLDQTNASNDQFSYFSYGNQSSYALSFFSDAKPIKTPKIKTKNILKMPPASINSITISYDSSIFRRSFDLFATQQPDSNNKILETSVSYNDDPRIIKKPNKQVS